MSEYTSPQQEQRQIGEYNSMTKFVARSILCTVDVARHNTVQIAPSDHESQGHTAFVNALGVVCAPGDRVGDAWIDTERSEESSSVFDPGSVVASTQKHGEAGDAQERDADVAPAAILGAISIPADQDGQDGGG